MLATRTEDPSVAFCIMPAMPAPQDQFAASIASEAVGILEDHLLFPGGYLLPLSARGTGLPGMADRPWSRLTADVFYPICRCCILSPCAASHQMFCVALCGLFEGFMMALAEKNRPPSFAGAWEHEALYIEQIFRICNNLNQWHHGDTFCQ